MKLTLFILSVSLAFIAHTALALPSEDSCSEKCMSVIQQYMANSNGQRNAERSNPTDEQLRMWASVYTNNATILFAAALSYDLNQSIEAAVPSFEAAYAASSYDTMIGNMYAGILLMDKQGTKAEKVLRELVDNNPYPQNLLPKFTLALALKGMQKYEEALPLFEEQNVFWRARNIQAAPKPNMDYATILMNIGICQLYLGKHKESIETLTLAESYWPTAAHIINYQAEAFLKDGQFLKAKEILLFAKENNRCDESTFYHLGLIEKENDPQLAEQYFQLAYEEGRKRLAVQQDNGFVYFLMYETAKELGLQKEASEHKKNAELLHFTHLSPWKKNQNQILDPTRKTPGDSVNAIPRAGQD